MANKAALEKLLWSIALPGLGQLLNHKYVKGILLLIAEFVVNVMSRFNEVILLSFHGQTEEAVNMANYGWLMFYPCLYFFAIWDAYKDAGGGKDIFSFIPFVSTAYVVTVGVIYSPSFTLFGILFGPVWLPILFVIPGLLLGLLVRILLVKMIHNRQRSNT
ncbi:hypothetical protein [Halobacillus hunanensis]|uniref:hypothetical protein n=1 Tax=Halobacillus hunanensis TaxID=578214 RepID=UPI0009A6FA2C|nr:hypothetical protein [Halobacillus hunanensis]